MIVLSIDGYDLTPYIAEGGLDYSRNDLDSKNSGRSPMNGVMHRGVIDSKVKLQVRCIPMPESVTTKILPIIKRPFVDVTYRDPEYGMTTKVFYSNNQKCKLSPIAKDGHVLWNGLSFPLIER